MVDFISFLNPIKSNLVVVLGGALGLSLLCNIGLGIYATHEAKQVTSYVIATKAANKAATVHKDIVENRNASLAQYIQDSSTNRVTSDIASLRSKSRIIYLPSAASSSSSVDGTGTGAVVSTPPIDLLEPVTAQQEADREICVTNTDLLKSWQDFYTGQLNIQKEENGNTSAGNHQSSTNITE